MEKRLRKQPEIPEAANTVNDSSVIAKCRKCGEKSSEERATNGTLDCSK